MNQRRRRILFVSALIMVIFAGVAYQFQAPPPMKVLVITLDTTRADRLGCCGHNEALPPAMDAVARDGVVV